MQPVAVQPHPLGRVVGQQPHRADPQVDQDLGADSVISGIGGQPELEVGVHGVFAGVLQLVGLQFVHQPDAAALVAAHVQHHAAPLPSDHRQRGIELGSAVATTGAEHVTGQALGVHAHQHVVTLTVGAADVATYQRHVFDLFIDAGVADRAKLPVPRRDTGFGDARDVLLVLAPPLGDGDQREIVFVGEDPEFVGLGHGAFVLLADDLADRAGGLQPRHAGEIDGGLGVAGPP